MTAGGAASLTEAQRALVRQSAMLTVQHEKHQAAMIRRGFEQDLTLEAFGRRFMTVVSEQRA
jgi:hypothetical protein